MNLADLSRMDVKDLQKIDPKKLLDVLRNRNDILMNIGIVVLTVILVINIISQAGQNIRKIKQEISKMEEKIAVINTLDTIKTELKEYLDNVPEAIDKDQLATMLTDWAAARGVKIVSVSPVKTKNADLYDTFSIDLNIETDSFKNLWLFIHDIESAPYALRIDRWQMEPTSQFRRYYPYTADAPQTLTLKVNTTLASVNVKKDE